VEIPMEVAVGGG